MRTIETNTDPHAPAPEVTMFCWDDPGLVSKYIASTWTLGVAVPRSATQSTFLTNE